MIDTRFIVAKKRLEIEMELRNSEHLRGNVFLHVSKGETGTPETPYDLMVDERKFLVFDDTQKGVCFVNKNAILRLDYSTAPLKNDKTVNFSALIEVKMSDGVDLRGKVIALLPEESGRLFDFLNHMEGAFMLLHKEGNNKVIINRHAVDKIMIV